MVTVFKSSSEGTGPNFNRFVVRVRNGTTGTDYSAGDVVQFDLGLDGDIADNNTPGLEDSGSSCVITPSDNSASMTKYALAGIMLEDLPASAGGLVSTGLALVRGIEKASVQATVSAAAGSAGDKLITVDGETSLDAVDPNDGQGNQKFYGILLEDASTSAAESLYVLFDGITGFR